MQNKFAVSASALARKVNLLYKVNFTQKVVNVQSLIPTLKALYIKTGKPVYIIGVISSYNVNGIKVGLPIKMHKLNRVRFAGVQKALLKAGIACHNPASVQGYGRAIKAPAWLVQQTTLTTCPYLGMYMLNKCNRTIARLHFANKRAARGCCALIMVNCNLSVLSIGTLQEVQYAAKYNPSAPLFGVY